MPLGTEIDDLDKSQNFPVTAQSPGRLQYEREKLINASPSANTYISAHFSKPHTSDGSQTQFGDGPFSGDPLRLEHGRITGRRQQHALPNARSTMAKDEQRVSLAFRGNRALREYSTVWCTQRCIPESRRLQFGNTSNANLCPR